MGIKKVVIVGVGGTGCHVLHAIKETQNLDITVIDGDLVQESNLERQILYNLKDIGMKKVDAITLPLTKISEFLTKENVEFLKDSDLVIDCTDNFQARFVIDDYCKADKIPWIYTAAIRNVGNVLFVDSKTDFKNIFKNKKGNACSEGIEIPVLQIVAKEVARIIPLYLKEHKYSKKLIRFNTSNNSRLEIEI